MKKATFFPFNGRYILYLLLFVGAGHVADSETVECTAGEPDSDGYRVYSIVVKNQNQIIAQRQYFKGKEILNEGTIVWENIQNCVIITQIPDPKEKWGYRQLIHIHGKQTPQSDYSWGSVDGLVVTVKQKGHTDISNFLIENGGQDEFLDLGKKAKNIIQELDME